MIAPVPEGQEAALLFRRSGVALAPRTSFKIGGEARELYEPDTPAEMVEVCRRLREEGREPYILGGGCNTLFPDGAFERPVVATEGLGAVRFEGKRVRAEAGARLEHLIRAAIARGLGGLEVFVGIPGTVGGATAMNAGGSGHSFGEVVTAVEGVRLATGELERLPASEVRWDYRSAHLDGFAVTAVELELSPGEPAILNEEARRRMRQKAARQPLSSASGGCIFKNPPGGAAAALLDRAGLKGAREGGAVISPLHANFIVNESRAASARDVLALLERARSRVEELFGVRLETEIIIPRGR